MSNPPIVSIILPVILPDDEFARCIYSIRSALVSRVTFEIICVARDADAFLGFVDIDIFFLRECKPGIYGAMNQGIDNARGRYLYFIGQDDILLPAAAEAILNGIKKDADLILANVFYGTKWIYKNYPSKHFLVWKNWCHQGVIYNRERFVHVVGSYPVQFKVQADHYANIVFSSTASVKIIKYNRCISWYSLGGFSSRTVDGDFRLIFPRLVRERIGMVDYCMVITRRLLLKIFRFLK